MARTDSDSWDLASSVGATATMVAAARALASREPGALIDDPFAAPLVRAVGVDFFTRLVDGDLELPDDTAEARAASQVLTEIMAVRTKFFDDFFVEAAAAGVRQAVILASGLDSRAYRLSWPDGTVVYEIDQPEVIAFKTQTLAGIGAEPAARHRPVAVDLREDWPAALRAAGFDDSAPAAWSAEGLLRYLPPAAQDRLFDEVTALSAPGSRLATEDHADAGAGIGEKADRLGRQWRDHGFDVNLSQLFYPGERTPVVDYLRERGWDVASRSRPEVFAGYGREFPDNDELASLRESLAVNAIREEETA
ncbi:class I SAM-dependent methyltransferase [Mycolicibacterium arseniciresistens]|uniref:S-adenosyl-L-methionine-dependent methyltransferase n=1 Tax=Mycolicibacterium arseniciresistens TaxID=3062257 RepID=A0ABT8UIP0_9MYCO|nr:class I SAM-dependent methyltransferase [Mycolicibacterium arseniciresistens]MDO3636059.1 class I SAM-dependent methyltransferase [Mycolicibacterium arseniciresistens]